MSEKNEDDVHRNREPIVPLTIAATRFTAEVYVAELIAHGVQAHVASDDASGWREGGFAEGYRVMVFENDIPAAREILAEVGDVEELPAEE